MIQQSILATRAAAILDFIGGMRGTLHVTFEEEPIRPGSTSAATARGQAGGMQPTHELAAEVGQQERCDRCAQAGRVVSADMLSPVYHAKKRDEVQHLAQLCLAD